MRYSPPERQDDPTYISKEEVILPITQEKRLRAVAVAALDRNRLDGRWPVAAQWPEGPLRVFVAPVEEGAANLPKTTLLFVEFEYGGKPFVASLGADD